MLKRLIKMVTKVKRDNRIKKARAKFENRYIKNQRIAQYEHKKMLEVSQQLRKKLNQSTNSSGDEYFAILKEVYNIQGRTLYDGALRKKHQRK